MGTQRKNPDSIKSMLADIRTYGMRNTQYTKRLLIQLTGKDDWSDEQCKYFFEALLHKYIKDEKSLHLMLAVSGINEEYGCLKNASERRRKYFEYLKANDPDEKREDDDSLRRGEEEYWLEYIARKLDEAIKSKKGAALVEELISGVNDLKDTKAKMNDSEQRDELKDSTHSNQSTIINNYGSVIIQGHNTDVNTSIQSNNVKIGSGAQNNTTNHSRKNKIHLKIPKKIMMTILVFLIAIGGGGIRYYELIRYSTIPVTDILLSTEEIVLKPSEYYEIKATVLPNEASMADLSYTSNDSEVATVSNKGIVLAQGEWEGEETRTAEITIQAESGVTVKMQVTVEKNNNSATAYPAADVDNFIPPYTIQISVRPAGTKGNNWANIIETNVGDELEYQIDYENISSETQYDVILRDYLPNNIEYIPGTTRLYNSLHDGDVYDSDRLFTDDGIHIGSYEAGANGYIRFNAKVVDNNLVEGLNTLVNWGQGWVGNTGLQDFAVVRVVE